MRALIIHGTMGSPEGNWFPWIKSELEEKGWSVDVPAFPTPDNQFLDSWVGVAKSYKECDLIIGHSIGATLALKLLEQGICTPKQTILISGVIKEIGNETYDVLNNSFIAGGFDWQKIQDNSSDIKILHGDDDPYVPLSHAQELAQHLNLPLDIIKDGGHLNTETDYDNFPYLLDLIND